MDIKIAKHYGGKKCAFSFVFDDGCYYSSTLETIKVFEEVFKKTGVKIKATSAQTVNFISEGLKSLWDKAIEDGWYDVCSHSIDHCICYNGETPLEKREFDARVSKEKLEEMYKTDMITFATPGGGATPEGCEILLKYYYAVRNGNDYINDPDNLSWADIGTFTTKKEYESEKYIEFINTLIKSGGWCVQIDHWLSEDENDKFFVQKTHTFLDECMFLATKSSEGVLWICSFNDAVKYYKERENAKVEILEENEKEITLRVNCPLPQKIFNFPLTLQIGEKYFDVIPNETVKIKI